MTRWKHEHIEPRSRGERHAMMVMMGGGGGIVRSKAVLLMDPSSDFVDLVSYLLEERGYRVQGAQSLLEGLRVLSEAQFDILMTEAFEQQNPYDFDPEFLDKVRARAGSTPIVLCSIYSSAESLQPGDFGLAAIITKPVDINDLEATLLRFLNDRDTCAD